MSDCIVNSFHFNFIGRQASGRPAAAPLARARGAPAKGRLRPRRAVQVALVRVAPADRALGERRDVGDGLADALERVLSDPELQQQMSAACAARAHSAFRWDEHARASLGRGASSRRPSRRSCYALHPRDTPAQQVSLAKHAGGLNPDLHVSFERLC